MLMLMAMLMPIPLYYWRGEKAFEPTTTSALGRSPQTCLYQV
jgi:hypothetical protein